MKKVAMILLALTILMVSSGCGVEFMESGEIGEVYNKSGFEYRVNYVEFADFIDGWEGFDGANDNLWKSLDDDSGFNPIGFSLEKYRADHGLKTSEDHTSLIVSFNVKNVDKSDNTIRNGGVINFDDGYEYEITDLAYREGDDEPWKTTTNGVILEKLTQKEYEFRARIIIPKEIETSDKPLTYTLFMTKIKLR